MEVRAEPLCPSPRQPLGACSRVIRSHLISSKPGFIEHSIWKQNFILKEVKFYIKCCSFNTKIFPPAAGLLWGGLRLSPRATPGRGGGRKGEKGREREGEGERESLLCSCSHVLSGQSERSAQGLLLLEPLFTLGRGEMFY